MKKVLLLIVLLMCPLLVNAASLIQGISVDGIGELGLSRNNWTVYLTTTLDYAEIDVIPANDNVTITGAGQVNVEEGDNTIVISATDGTSTEEYTINLKVSRPTSDGSGNPETGAFLSLSVIGSALIIGFVVSKMKKAKIIKI